MKRPGKRRLARSMAVQMLYQSDLGGAHLPQIFRSFDLDPYLTGVWDDPEAGLAEPPSDLPPRAMPVPPAPDPALAPVQRDEATQGFEHAKELVEGTLEHRDEIDALIREQADNWRLERMPAVDRNILRLAIFEMLYEEDVPKLVVVDEAIDLAKQFGSEQSGRFVNGLLDGLLRAHKFPGRMT